MKSPILLASESPRRRELLSLIIEKFEVKAPNIEENYPSGLSFIKIPEFLAQKKAQALRSCFPQHIIIGSDTVVCLDKEILGKPKNENDAQKKLEILSGQTHQVITGCAVLFPDGNKSIFTTVTDVTFYPLNNIEIKNYIATGEPMDKAGAYGIQGKGACFIKEIKGDYYSVMGLPVAMLYHILKQEY